MVHLCCKRTNTGMEQRRVFHTCSFHQLVRTSVWDTSGTRKWARQPVFVPLSPALARDCEDKTQGARFFCAIGPVAHPFNADLPGSARRRQVLQALLPVLLWAPLS